MPCVLAIDYTPTWGNASACGDAGSIQANIDVIEDHRFERRGPVIVSLKGKGFIGGDVSQVFVNAVGVEANVVVWGGN